jgi:hypothetical protein
MAPTTTPTSKANRIRWHKHPNVQQHPNPFDKAKLNRVCTNRVHTKNKRLNALLSNASLVHPSQQQHNLPTFMALLHLP